MIRGSDPERGRIAGGRYAFSRRLRGPHVGVEVSDKTKIFGLCQPRYVHTVA